MPKEGLEPPRREALDPKSCKQPSSQQSTTHYNSKMNYLHYTLSKQILPLIVVFCNYLFRGVPTVSHGTKPELTIFEMKLSDFLFFKPQIGLWSVSPRHC